MSWGGLWRSWDVLAQSSAGPGAVLGSLGVVLGGLGTFGTPQDGSQPRTCGGSSAVLGALGGDL